MPVNLEFPFEDQLKKQLAEMKSVSQKEIDDLFRGNFAPPKTYTIHYIEDLPVRELSSGDTVFETSSGKTYVWKDKELHHIADSSPSIIEDKTRNPLASKKGQTYGEHRANIRSPKWDEFGDHDWFDIFNP